MHKLYSHTIEYLKMGDNVDVDLILKCAELSNKAYNDTQPEDFELSPVAFIDEKCWIFIGQDTLYIVFRGTDSMSDMMNNLNFCSEPISKEMPYFVHRGYKAYYKTVKQHIINYVSMQADRFKRVIVTGHSLGGASAVLSTLDIVHYIPDIVCVTFGTPPIASRDYSEYQEKKVPHTYRVINAEDWAPRLPVPFLYHVGKPILLCNNYAPPLPSSPHKIVYSHGMSRYVSCLHTHRTSCNMPLTSKLF